MYNNLRKNKLKSWCYKDHEYKHKVKRGREFVFYAEDAITDLLWWYWVYKRNPNATPWYQYQSQALIDVCNLPLKREGAHWYPTGDVVASIVPLIDWLNGEPFWNSFSVDGSGVKAFEDRGEPHLE